MNGDVRGRLSGPDPTVGGSWVAVGQADCPGADSAVRVELGGIPVCLVRSGGVIHALFDECSHGRVPLSEGTVGGGFIECWWHGSRFDLDTGIPAGPPAAGAVAVYPVRVTAGGIEVAVPGTRTGGARG